ncbi:MAG: SH3 domain-containing protein [Saprospiraceae bacterium]|nr:SH3 domain-containing protein [Saprospiraceae bacterium]
MNWKIKCTLLLALLSTCLSVAFGQMMEVNEYANQVIANGGLNLREKPSKNAKILANIPFGDSVQYVSNKSWKIDSVVIPSLDYTPHKRKIMGHWVKVKYHGQTGYALDIFLSHIGKGKFHDEFKDSDEFRLLFNYCNCVYGNVHNPDLWTWYGYFKENDSTLIARKIDVSYYIDWDDMTCAQITHASEEKNLQFIIGTKTATLKKKVKIRASRVDVGYYGKTPLSEVQKELNRFSIRMDIEKIKDKDYPTEYRKLYLVHEFRQALLNPLHYGTPQDISFIGDLDGDGLDDYIISYSREKGGPTILYLSSRATPATLIKPVAVYESAYCC